MEELLMASTLEESLERQEKRLGKDSFVAKMLRDQIRAQKRGQSAHDIYVTRSVKKDNKQ
jgi:hypothetical protein